MKHLEQKCMLVVEFKYPHYTDATTKFRKKKLSSKSDSFTQKYGLLSPSKYKGVYNINFHTQHVISAYRERHSRFIDVIYNSCVLVNNSLGHAYVHKTRLFACYVFMTVSFCLRGDKNFEVEF